MAQLKDVTVALELTLPDNVSDCDIKAFVEKAIAEAVLAARKEYFYNCDDVAWKSIWSFNGIDWKELGFLGIQEYMADVTAVMDGSFEQDSRERHWRMAR